MAPAGIRAEEFRILRAVAERGGPCVFRLPDRGRSVTARVSGKSGRETPDTLEMLGKFDLSAVFKRSRRAGIFVFDRADEDGIRFAVVSIADPLLQAPFDISWGRTGPGRRFFGPNELDRRPAKDRALMKKDLLLRFHDLTGQDLSVKMV